MDCLEGLDHIEKKSVDLLLTDPPFGINFHRVGSQYNRKQKELGKLYHEVPEAEYYDFTLAWLKKCKVAMKPTASGFIFSGWNRLGDILKVISKLNFRLVNHIIWKFQFGVFTKKRYVTSHYHILYFTLLKEKNDKLRTFNRISEYSTSPGKFYFEDVWRIKRDYQKGGDKTPTRLPLAVTDKCIRMASKERDLILEPFLGSGSVVLSAMKFNRDYIGFEISKDIFRVAEKRKRKMEKELAAKGDSLDDWIESSDKS
ncbi:MAG: DNA-methyltransferase [Candidatus Hodarchaeales archaeon]|jgi:site-specific DNA-methyltransferase (adenine-specific)